MKQRLGRYLFMLAVLGGGSSLRWLQAQVFPSLALAPRLSGLQFPVAITHAGVSSGHLFMVEQMNRATSIRRLWIGPGL